MRATVANTSATSSSRLASLVFAVVVLAVPVVYFLAFQGSFFAWGDEVEFVDPAASAHFGQGFTSMAWPYQGPDEFFAGNATGYSMLLVPWFAIVGFGLDQARWINLPLAAAAVLLLWSALGRVSPGMPVWLKALAISASFLGAGVLLSTGSARYDVLGILAAAWLFFLIAGPARRPISLFVLGGIVVFYAGFHLVAATVIIFALLLIQDRTRFLRPAMAIVAGVACGLASLLAILVTQGLSKKFFIMLFGSQHTISGQMAKFARNGGGGGNPLLAKLQAFAGLPALDPSLNIAAAFLLLMLVLAWRSRAIPSVAPAAGLRLVGWLALDFVLILPAALLFIGKFPVYYDWMAYIPAILIGSVWVQMARERGLAWPLPLFVVSLAAAVGIGAWERSSARDMPLGSPVYAQFNGWVADQLKPTDWVYTDFEAYFAARRVAHRVIAPTYAQSALLPGIPEHALVSAILVHKPNADRLTELIGGTWKQVGAFGAGEAAALSNPLDYVLLRRDVAAR